VRKLVARVFDYSVDGLTAQEGSEFFQFCRDLPDDPAQVTRTTELHERADLHIMGRTVYEGMAGYFPTAVDHPYADLLNAARKVVFSRTLPTPHAALCAACGGAEVVRRGSACSLGRLLVRLGGPVRASR